MTGLIFTSNQWSLSAERCQPCPLVNSWTLDNLLTNNAWARIDVQASWKILKGSPNDGSSQVEFSSDIKRTYSSPVSSHPSTCQILGRSRAGTPPRVRWLLCVGSMSKPRAIATCLICSSKVGSCQYRNANSVATITLRVSGMGSVFQTESLTLTCVMKECGWSDVRFGRDAIESWVVPYATTRSFDQS
jgi:hypothetical protein